MGEAGKKTEGKNGEPPLAVRENQNFAAKCRKTADMKGINKEIYKKYFKIIQERGK